MTCKQISANFKWKDSFSINETCFWNYHMFFETLEQPNVWLVKQSLAAMKITEAAI